ncbi:MAG: aminotransferase class V-fold PLP-dependent enzyme [Flavobacteriales bacterium]|nr:aminotransferase class V-fold PLP-dependent enzyme [Flavobacteriales bacterium]
MDELLNRLADCESRSELLEPAQSVREDLMRTVQDYADHFIASLKDCPAYISGHPDLSRLRIDGRPTPLNQLLKDYDAEVNTHGIKPASGGHIGYIPGGGIYAAALGDYLADVTNEYAGMYFGSPGAVAIENELIDWLKQVFHFPETSVGNLASGGSIANLIALTAARDKHGIKNERIRTSVVYLSEQVHHCIHKALRIIGLEDVQVRYLELDERSRIKTADLKQKIAEDRRAGLNPFLVIASAGTTDTGAVDPLREIGTIAAENKLWYHVDGAYGGFFILCNSKKQLFSGIEMADSLVIDPHKGLFLPYGLGAVLVKDKEAVFHSHHYTANYMQDAQVEGRLNPADLSPELTKHFRGLRLWLPLKLYGIEPFIACLDEKLLLTAYFRRELQRIGFEVGPEPDLSVSYFWYPAPGPDKNRFNEMLMQEVHRDGRVFLSSTRLNGKFVIRMAILAFRTKKITIDRAIAMLETCVEQTKAQFK